MRNEVRPRIPIAFIGITVGITVFLFPTGLQQFMKMQYLYNEVLQNHQNNTEWIWYVQELSKLFQMSLLQFLIVGVGLAATLVPWARLRNLPIGWRSKLLALMGDPCLMTIIVCGNYLTFFVVGKDFRTAQFLFILSVAWIVRAIASRIPTSMYLVLIIATTIPTFLVGQKLLMIGDNFATFERFGYDRLFQAIVSDHELIRKPLGEKPAKISAFISVFSNEFNDSLSGFQNARCGLSKDKHLCLKQPTIDAHSAPFAKGTWGYPGGFPKTFFSDDYVVLMFPRIVGEADTVDVYNPLIQEKIFANDPAFLDGLTHVTDIEITNGNKWILFRRDRIPSQSAFVQILKAAMNRDPENIWNEPWRLAVKKIEDPNFFAESSAETERRTILLSRNHFTPELSTWGVWLLEILHNSEKSIREAQYPGIISAATF